MAHPLNTAPLRRNFWRSRVAGCLMTLLVAACGGSDPDGSAPVQGVITGADGASVDFAPAEGMPAPALSITRAESGAPPLPADVVAAGAVYQFSPQGHVGNAIEITVPFTAAQTSGSSPRLLVALAGDDAWSEVESQPNGAALRARVPALGYAVVVRPLAKSSAESTTASGSQAAQYLRGRLSAEPPLQGSGLLRTATAPSTLTATIDYSFARSCASPVQLQLRALVVRPRSSTQELPWATVDLGSRSLSSRSGSERFDLPLTTAQNGTWVFFAYARCVEQGRVPFTLLATLPVLVVKGPAAPPPPPTEGSATIGAAGGVVNGPDGVQLVVPEGALDADVTIRIARSAAGAPALPEDVPAGIAIYEITPHDLRFGRPVTVRLPFTGPAQPDGVALVASPGGNWRFVPAIAVNGFVEISRTSLSWYGAGWGASFGCAAAPGDPFPCQRPFIGPGGPVTTSPVGAINRISVGSNVVQDGITQAATLTVPVAVSAARDCTNASVTVTRGIWNTFPPRAPAQQILQQSIALAPSQTSSSRSEATFTIQTSVTAADNGAISLQFFFECSRSNGLNAAFAGLDYLIRIEPPAAAPTITQQPANLAVAAGDRARFSVLASAANGLSVTWERSNDGGATWPAQGADTPIAGGSALDLSAQLADNGALFRARVCNGSGPTQTCLDSGSATLTVTPAPLASVFTTQPLDLSVVAGQSASFTAVAAGRPAPSVRWQAAVAGTSNFADVVGEAACSPTAAPGSGERTASTCTIGQTDAGRSGLRLRALASNAAAADITSNVATLTINPAAVPASITQQPIPQSTAVGGTATFSVGAVGTAPLSFIWRLNGTDMPSAFGSFTVGTCTGFFTPGPGTGTFSGLSVGCNGLSVTVSVSNGVGPGATSSPATLTVMPGRPLILGSPTSQFVDIGQTGTFTVQAEGVGLTYQWQRIRARGVNLDTGEITYGFFEDIPGATSSTFTTPPATISDDLSAYAVRVCNGAVQPAFPNCWFVGIVGQEVKLRINEVVSQNFGSVASGTSSNLLAVAFATPSIGVAVGEDGTIVRTTNAGQTWTPVASGTVGRLRSVAFGAGGRGVVTGSSGLLFSADAGATWRASLAGDNGVCCTSVAYPDAATALVTYRDGFLRSTDGGQNFAFGFRTPSFFGYDVRFGSAANGAAVDGVSSLFTTDGGVTWSPSQPLNLGAATLAFASSSIAVATNGGGLFRSTNGGIAWAPLYGGGFTRYANALAFNGGGVGLALQGPAFGAMHTSDFGQTWIPLALPGLTARINGLTFVDPKVAIAVGEGGTILRFTEAGL